MGFQSVGVGPTTVIRPWHRIASKRVPLAQELQLGVALPHQLMAWGWIVLTTKMAADLRDQTYGLPEPERGQ